jgi:hypothetical protein
MIRNSPLSSATGPTPARGPLPVRRRPRPCGLRGLAANLNLVRVAWGVLGRPPSASFQLANPTSSNGGARPGVNPGVDRVISQIHQLIQLHVAEREGFEPPIGLHLCRISSAVHSTTLPPLQAPRRVIPRPAVGACSRRGWRARQGAGARFPKASALKLYEK